MTETSHFERKTKTVVILTAITMVVEIVIGINSHSMALLADGIHMGSHVLAIGLSWLAYVVIRKLSTQSRYSIDASKLLSLSGYTSGLLLLVFAVYIAIEAMDRLISPVEIQFKEAIIIAVAGLIINILSAFILHHEHHDSDHNIKAAYLHVLADAVTSIAAILGLVAAWIWQITFIDAIAALLSSLIIIKWSIGLLKEAGLNLMDFKKSQESV
jgi:cation diffusion facilitator family transporter